MLQWGPQGLQVVRKDGCYFYYNSALISQVSWKKSLVVFEVVEGYKISLTRRTDVGLLFH